MTPEKGAGLSCTAPAQRVSMTAWSIGGRALPKGTIIAQKIEHLGNKIGGAPYAGLLGGDVLSQFGSMRLDFKAAKLVLGAPAPAHGTGTPISVVKVGQNVFTVIALRINGQISSWQLDTGASGSAIDSGVANTLKLPTAGNPIKIVTVSCKRSAQPVRIAHWSTIKGQSLAATISVSAPSEITKATNGRLVGLMVENVLASFGKDTIDFSGERAYFGN